MILYFNGQKVKINLNSVCYKLNIAPRVFIDAITSENEQLIDANNLFIQIYQ